MCAVVGIIKELREAETVSFDSKAVAPIVLIKEVATKGLIRRSEQQVPTALMYGNVYVTDQRLLFLVFYQMKAEEARKGNTADRLSGISPKWFAVPIESIQQVEVRGVDSRMSNYVKRFLQKSGEPDVVDQTGVEVVYGGRELTEEDRDFSRSLLQMGALQRLTTRAEGISDKMFIGTDRASLLASSVQAAMGIRASLEAEPDHVTQQFSILDPDPRQTASALE